MQCEMVLSALFRSVVSGGSALETRFEMASRVTQSLPCAGMALKGNLPLNWHPWGYSNYAGFIFMLFKMIHLAGRAIHSLLVRYIVK